MLWIDKHIDWCTLSYLLDTRSPDKVAKPCLRQLIACQMRRHVAFTSHLPIAPLRALRKHQRR